MVDAKGTGQVDLTQRVSSCIVDVGPLTVAFRERMLGVGYRLMTDLGVPPFEIARVELEVVANNDGGFFSTHLDTLLGQYAVANERRISAVYYFHSTPKAFSGGALRFHPIFKEEGGPDHVDVEPVDNTLVVFPSFLQHEVLRVSCPSRAFAASRFTVNAWLLAKRG